MAPQQAWVSSHVILRLNLFACLQVRAILSASKRPEVMYAVHLKYLFRVWPEIASDTNAVCNTTVEISPIPVLFPINKKVILV